MNPFKRYINYVRMFFARRDIGVQSTIYANGLPSPIFQSSTLIEMELNQIFFIDCIFYRVKGIETTIDNRVKRVITAERALWREACDFTVARGNYNEHV